MKNKTIIITIIVFILLLALSTFGYKRLKEKDFNKTGVSQTEIVENEDENIPVNFKITDSNGKVKELDSFKGKPTVVNFWATWCGYCVREMPDFQKVYDKYGNDVNFIMLNTADGERETEENARAFMKENGYTMPLYFEFNHEASSRLQVYSFPTTVIFNKDGKVVMNHPGLMTESALESAIENVM